ncbi:hypothetical protein BJ166DRAFT_591638 [Pestalotiopsis sp. NC0098]|nr:hypothetical protein BJ166DRAFT_591638 [Pestalotiopsis sp. NC0098]
MHYDDYLNDTEANGMRFRQWSDVDDPNRDGRNLYAHKHNAGAYLQFGGYSAIRSVLSLNGRCQPASGSFKLASRRASDKEEGGGEEGLGDEAAQGLGRRSFLLLHGGSGFWVPEKLLHDF